VQASSAESFFCPTRPDHLCGCSITAGIEVPAVVIFIVFVPPTCRFPVRPRSAVPSCSTTVHGVTSRCPSNCRYRGIGSCKYYSYKGKLTYFQNCPFSFQMLTLSPTRLDIRYRFDLGFYPLIDGAVNLVSPTLAAEATDRSDVHHGDAEQRGCGDSRVGGAHRW